MGRTRYVHRIYATPGMTRKPLPWDDLSELRLTIAGVVTEEGQAHCPTARQIQARRKHVFGPTLTLLLAIFALLGSTTGWDRPT